MDGKDCLTSAETKFRYFFDLHANQINSSGIPHDLCRSLYEKLTENVFDAGDCFTMVQVTDSESEEDNEEENDSSGGHVENTFSWTVAVTKEGGISVQDATNIFLVDHAWTYRASTARSQLMQIPGLLDRMTTLMDLPANDDKEFMVNQILTNMWKYNQSYSIGGQFVEAEDSVPVWYIMDEFGSRIQHSDKPNFRIVPFLFLPDQVAYSVLFPITDVPYGGEITRNYLEGPISDPLILQALSLPWIPADFTHIDCNQVEPEEEFLRSGRVEESLPDLTVEFPKVSRNSPLKVYAEYNVLKNNLKHRAFQITESQKDADILWLNYHFKHYQELSEESPHKFVNQFPFEHIITVKDLLAITSRRSVSGQTINPETLETQPIWLPTTFNLKTELPKFVSYFQQSESRDLSNYWICKPWNLARSLDTHITDILNCILRLSVTGPKIACKYVTDPVLFSRGDVGLVKFDLRYIILLRSVKPLKVYAYKRFWLRFANRPFSLDNFEDYEKHFTVMNYNKANLKQLFCHEFINKFEEYYPEFKWEQVEESIFAMLRSLFEAATSKAPPSGIGHSPQSRAVYAADIILQWKTDQNGVRQIQPLLLEINWSPDCQRACQYYPEFYDDIFSVLFLDETENRNVKLL